ncbi:hypothetical protein BGV68_03685 [Burkholderia ubonensis]|uniref:hypothetical protein n=1 Tax=Burkholderia ubonensis TaxID=101571 RepID=UPI0008FE844F|nr:hypothetical protein [Burkholderia ubonensis]OJA62955.1 hypothetical protein BGV68_03685 [Burkholderia ubonensis]
MSMIEADFYDQPQACRPRASLLVPFALSGPWPRILVDGTAVGELWPWAQTQIRRVNSLDDVRAQITVLNAQIAAQQEQAAAKALRASSAGDGFDFRAAVELKTTRLRVHVLQVALRHLEVLERRQQREALGCEESEQGGVSSPSWEIWQRFIRGASIEMVGLPSEQALAQEMVDAGLLHDADAKFVASAIRCLTTSIAMKMERGLFFEEIARPFVHDYLETLSMAAASVRTLAARWMLDGPSETGSAAAIAKRLNPLGAPPHFA